MPHPSLGDENLNWEPDQSQATKGLHRLYSDLGGVAIPDHGKSTAAGEFLIRPRREVWRIGSCRT
jgi:hypothetical protein